MVTRVGQAGRLPDSATRAFAAEFASLRNEIEILKRAQRSAGLANSSIENGFISVNDESGTLRQTIGMQSDGTVAILAHNAPTPPPIPNTPTVDPFPAGLNIAWNGDFPYGSKPYDFLFVEVHIGSTMTFIPGPSTMVGTLREAGLLPVTPLSSGSTYYALLIAVNTSGMKSDPTLTASGVPSDVVATSILDGIVDTLALADDAVTRAKVATGAIGSAEIGNNEVLLANLADGSVNANKLIDGAVTGPKLVDGVVSTAKIAPLAITTALIANGAVNTTQIANAAVNTTQIAPLAITTALIGPAAVGAGKIAADAVTANEIAANSITASEISANAVTAGKIAADAVTANEIAANAITTSELAANAVTAGKIAADTITANEIAAGAITSSELAANSVIAGKILADSITATEIAASAITSNELAANSVIAGKILADSITANEIAANAITASEIAANAVTAAKILADTITANEIAANAITANELAANSVVAGKIAAGIITSTEIAANTIVAGNIAASTITTTEIAALTILAGDIAADAIAAGKIAADAVTAREIAALTITAAEIAANTITASELAAGSVTAVKLAADLVISQRIIAGNATGGRMELHPTSGLQGFQTDGTTRTFWFDNSTGNALITGKYQSALTGEHIEILTAGELRFYNTNGIDYARLSHISTDVALRGPLNASSRSGRINLGSTTLGLAFCDENSISTGGLFTFLSMSQTDSLYIAPTHTMAIDGMSTHPPAGSRLIQFCMNDSANASIADSFLTFARRASGGGCVLAAPAQNCSLAFNGSNVFVRNAADTAMFPIQASAFTVGSSRTIKHRFRDIEWNGKTALDLVQAVESQEYEYITDTEYSEDPLPTGTGVFGHAPRIDPDTGEQALDGDGQPIWDRPEVMIDVVPPPTAPKRYGPMAEDIMAIAPGVVEVDAEGNYQISAHDLSGVLWKATSLLAKREVKMIDARKIVPALTAGTPVDVTIDWTNAPLPKAPSDVSICREGFVIGQLIRMSTVVLPNSVTVNGCTVRVNIVGPDIAANQGVLHATATFWI